MFASSNFPAIAITLAMLIGAGCRVREQNDAHCGFQGGDAYCEQVNADRPFCVADEPRCHIGDGLGVRSGCVSPIVFEQLDPSCHWQCGSLPGLTCERSESGSTSSALPETTSNDAHASLGGVSEAGNDSSMTTDAPGCADHEGCVEAQAPICEDEICRPCSTASECLEKDPGTTQCIDGECLPPDCTIGTNEGCGAERPVCDAGTLTCRACEVDDECGERGLCVPTVVRGLGGYCFYDGVYVDPNAEGGGGDGSASHPFTSIADAIDVVTPGTPTIVRLASTPAGEPYRSEFDVAGLTVAFAAAPGAERRPIIDGGESRTPLFTADSGTQILLDRLEFRDTTSVPILRAAGGNLAVMRSTFAYNLAGIALVEEGNLSLVNVAATKNGSYEGRRAMFRMFGGEFLLLNTTIFGNHAVEGTPLHFDCAQFAEVEMRNSIMTSLTSYVPYPDPMETGTSYVYADVSTGEGSDATGSTGGFDTDGASTGSGSGTGDEDDGRTILDFYPQPGESQSASCSFGAIRSAVDSPLLVGPGTILLGSERGFAEGTDDYDPTWFANDVALDFRLSPHGREKFGDLGMWLEGDPRDDWAGRRRVRTPGATEAAGAAW